MFDFISNNLHYILPPIMGFFIGSATNGLAIYMLFHPYKEKRLFGFKLPFTPGAIPREHKRISVKISEVVCDNLLTVEEIAETLNRPQVKDYIFQEIGSNIDNVVNADTRSIYSLVPPEWEPYFYELIRNINDNVTKEIGAMLDNASTDEVVRSFVNKEINELLDFRLELLFDKDHIAKLEGIIKTVVTKVYNSMGLKDKACYIINQQLDDFLFSSSKVNEVLSSELMNVIEYNVVSQTEILTESLFLQLKKERALDKVEEELKKSAKEHFRNLRFMPRFISSHPLTNQKLDTFLDELVDDVRGDGRINNVERIVIAKLKVVMKDKLKIIFEDEVKGLMQILPPDVITQIKTDLEKKLYALFSSEDLENTLIGELDKKIIGFEEFEMQSLIPHLTESEISKVKDFIANAILKSMRREESKHIIAENVITSLDKRLHKSIGKLSEILPSGLVEKIKQKVSEKSLNVIKEAAPEFLKSMDIKAMIQEKVEAFPLNELEKIILQVAGSELKNITLLGGIIGFVVGLLQIFIK